MPPPSPVACPGRDIGVIMTASSRVRVSSRCSRVSESHARVDVDLQAQGPAPRGKLNRIEVDFLDGPSPGGEERDTLFGLFHLFFEDLG